jgi:hypothetical protein
MTADRDEALAQVTKERDEARTLVADLRDANILLLRRLAQLDQQQMTPDLAMILLGEVASAARQGLVELGDS